MDMTPLVNGTGLEKKFFGFKEELAFVNAADCNIRLNLRSDDYSPSGVSTTAMFKRIPLGFFLIPPGI